MFLALFCTQPGDVHEEHLYSYLRVWVAAGSKWMEVRILVSAVQLLVRAGRIIGEVGDRIWGLPISAEVW